MGIVGSRGWVALTHNKHLSALEKAVVRNAGLRLFVLIGQRGHPDLAETARRALPRIATFLAAHPGPFIARVHRPDAVHLKHNPNAGGRIKQWAPPW